MAGPAMTWTNLKNQKIDDELRWMVGEYRYDLPHRLHVQQDVVDAIDQFCEQTCEWVASRLDNYITDCGWIYEVFYGYRQLTCPHCGKRVVERWGRIGGDDEHTNKLLV